MGDISIIAEEHPGFMELLTIHDVPKYCLIAFLGDNDNVVDQEDEDENPPLRFDEEEEDQDDGDDPFVIGAV
ncbi:hypothetical protein M422DRAFT_242921 [Sphaerobolus stellatus SS14]|nr:hypothetical protein M422DRAFT_242921 [Sphaerobolus stellatus SS14]